MKNFQIKNLFNKSFKGVNLNSGFTLVESLFAVMTLTFTITVLMTVVSGSLFSSRYSKDEIIINYLMQEVVDYIRNDRDTEVFLNNVSFETFYTKYEKCSTQNGGCYFAIKNGLVDTINSCGFGDDCPYLSFDKDASSGSFYNYNTVEADSTDDFVTTIHRKILVNKDETDSNIINVKVITKWKNGSSALERELKMTMTNWR